MAPRRPPPLSVWRRSERYTGPAGDGDNLVHRWRASAASAGGIKFREHALYAGARHAEHEHTGFGTGFIAEGMLLAARSEEERPCSKPLWRGLIGALQNDLAGQHVESLVLVRVGMRRHARARRDGMLDAAEAIVRPCTAQ